MGRGSLKTNRRGGWILLRTTQRYRFVEGVQHQHCQSKTSDNEKQRLHWDWPNGGIACRRSQSCPSHQLWYFHWHLRGSRTSIRNTPWHFRRSMARRRWRWWGRRHRSIEPTTKWLTHPNSHRLYNSSMAGHCQELCPLLPRRTKHSGTVTATALPLLHRPSSSSSCCVCRHQEYRTNQSSRIGHGRNTYHEYTPTAEMPCPWTRTRTAYCLGRKGSSSKGPFQRCLGEAPLALFNSLQPRKTTSVNSREPSRRSSPEELNHQHSSSTTRGMESPDPWHSLRCILERTVRQNFRGARIYGHFTDSGWTSRNWQEKEIRKAGAGRCDSFHRLQT